MDNLFPGRITFSLIWHSSVDKFHSRTVHYSFSSHFINFDESHVAAFSNFSPGNGFKLNLKAWINGPIQTLRERHSFGKRYKPLFHRLRVKAVKEDRHVIYIEKDASLEEIVSDKSPSPEDGIVKGKESDFEEVELRVPAQKTHGFSLDAENEGSAFENYDDEDFPRSSGELPPKSIFATINHTEEEAEPVNNSYGA
ncbi:unnamed protein product [Angiostrongylus costaricensis]|uniref:TMV resistance protein N-like n=1 Tax=Angiostrongylus costaricensis TaxID=334426 RepID=A0A0R3PUM8_ANGCS|nr:unnamed protein product [Angiostrongylus costaricensis]